MNIFIINGAQVFAHSGGKLNKAITEWDKDFFSSDSKYDIRITDINTSYNPEKEVENFVWADVIIYHFPIWWFSLPHKLKEYLDHVLTVGHRKGLYYSDGRKMDNPNRNYGTAGLLQGKSYLVTSTWNAPAAAFTLEDEFFGQTSVDDGVLFGFHKMNAFLSLQRLESFHFHDVEKNLELERFESYRIQYLEHLKKTIGELKSESVIETHQ
ncbi:NAD(P)H-dependent oxidoreductase [Flavobacterium silvaticum]|uniref:NAD(P)H-dependent oxidoreductase n=1 Tax=Flavobacterium silvaticum TaxID=1852020 RepID=A0A972JJB0_9FLAO|nr:NAD(P)H-dependent oxidoreductase [Flavobacterium silvaticum]NMH28032.1 NAD(P)H-dependent oxidoreductase [Flavobacterium silvaticum]